MKPVKLSLEKDNDTWFLVLSAMRYCIGRRTYAPSLCADWIRRHWGVIPPSTRFMLRRDLGDEIRRASGDERLLGDACDVATWRDLWAWMSSRPDEDYGGLKND